MTSSSLKSLHSWLIAITRFCVDTFVALTDFAASLAASGGDADSPPEAGSVTFESTLDKLV